MEQWDSMSNPCAAAWQFVLYTYLASTDTILTLSKDKKVPDKAQKQVCFLLLYYFFNLVCHNVLFFFFSFFPASFDTTNAAAFRDLGL